MKRIVSIFLLLLFLGCGFDKGDGVFKKSAFLMGTIVNVTVVDADAGEASLKMEKALDEMRRIEKMMGRTIPASDVYKINEAAGKAAVTVKPETLKVIRDALPVTRLTGGKFDVTIGPLTNLWNIEKNGKRMFIPTVDAIKRAKSLMGLDDLEVDEKNSTVFLKRKGMSVDLSGIAKGYAVDRAIETLKAQGIRGGIVDAGGDLRLFGYKPDGKAWRTGIQHPRKPDKLIFILELTDTVVITSGDYERYFIKDGVRYHHILDPITGYPSSGCQSVTIVTHSAGFADAIGTGVFALGPEKGMALIDQRDGIEGVIVTQDGEKLVSRGLKGKIEVL